MQNFDSKSALFKSATMSSETRLHAFDFVPNIYWMQSLKQYFFGGSLQNQLFKTWFSVHTFYAKMFKTHRTISYLRVLVE